MGTDIHFFAERKNANGQWECMHDEDPKWGGLDESIFYSRRNYDLFSILADVRNGFGFAGVPTGTKFNPIDTDRGMPDDASPGVQEQWDSRGEHTPSWLLLSEILSYDWDQTTTKMGLLTDDEYAAWDHKTEPASYCGGAGGAGVVVMDESDFVRLKQGGDLPPAERLYVRVQWEQSYRVSAAGFLKDTVPALQKLGDPEDVRVVFWFDS